MLPVERSARITSVAGPASVSAEVSREAPLDELGTSGGAERPDEWLTLGASADARRRALGLDDMGPEQKPRSAVLRTLGSSKSARVSVPAVAVDRDVVWADFDLLRELGFDVPKSNMMTPELERAVLDAFSYRALKPGEKPPEGARLLTLSYDRYGGRGTLSNKGSCRSGLLDDFNVSLVGAGLAHANHGTIADAHHSTGTRALWDSVKAATNGLVHDHNFDAGSTRVVAVLADPDGHDVFVHADHGSEQQALEARAGAQMRVGHMLRNTLISGTRTQHTRAARHALDIFVRQTRFLGLLETHVDPLTGKTEPDLDATFSRLVDVSAQQAAQAFVKRTYHGSLTPSNQQTSAQQVDLSTGTAAGGTGELKNGTHHPFGSEYAEMGENLDILGYQLGETLSAEERERFNWSTPNLRAQMEKAYRAHLTLELLKSAGLKAEVARRLAPDPTARKFMQSFLALAKLPLPEGSLPKDYTTDGDLSRTSAVDAFGLLARLPPAYFRNQLTLERAESFLAPRYDLATAEGRQQRTQALSYLGHFLTAYGALMNQATQQRDVYRTPAELAQSVYGRAHFENQPLDQLYYGPQVGRIRAAVDSLRYDKNPEPIRREIDDSVTASLRNFDALLRAGQARRMGEGALELQRRTIRGVTYSLEAHPDGQRTVRLHLAVDGSPAEGYGVDAGDRLYHLSEEQLAQTRFHGSLEKNGAPVSAPAQIERNGAGRPTGLSFELPLAGPSSQVRYPAGMFAIPGTHGLRDRGEDFRGAVLAVPDRGDLLRLACEFEDATEAFSQS